MRNDEIDKQLVERAKSDPIYFAEIFDKYYNLILRYIIHRIGDIEVSKDIAAETFYKALNKISTYHPTTAPFSAWLYRIASNEINYFFRRKKYEPVSLDSSLKEINLQIPSSIDIENELIAAQEMIDNNKKYQMAKEMLYKLPEKYQEVLVLRFMEDLKIVEISRILGKSEGTVKSLISRGIDKLKKILNK
ncbi:MAG: sigma-70 family RNA polymerase sigma factor [Candidatus Goldbacteria bacterium]|nr:sigma-70 family RNA polymerase sigma factor [Candidatus Goldiibacteriota bacterium]